MVNVCLCGCGEQVERRFKQGHDAKVKGAVLRLTRGEGDLRRFKSKTLRAYLAKAPWLTAEMRKALDL